MMPALLVALVTSEHDNGVEAPVTTVSRLLPPPAAREAGEPYDQKDESCAEHDKLG